MSERLSQSTLRLQGSTEIFSSSLAAMYDPRKLFFHACSGPSVRVWVSVRVYIRVEFGSGLGFELGLGTSWTGTSVEKILHTMYVRP